MSRPIQDLTGQTIGKLTLLERTNTKQNGAYIYRCLCECGREVFKSRTTLIGALRGEWLAHCGCLGWGRLRGARDKIVNVRPQSICFYCAEEPSQQHSVQDNVSYLYNGIDRVENSQGYTHDNCVPCCGTCNRMKHTMTYDEFVARVVQIAKNLKVKM